MDLAWAFTRSRLTESNRRPTHYEIKLATHVHLAGSRPACGNGSRHLSPLTVAGCPLEDQTRTERRTLTLSPWTMTRREPESPRALDLRPACSITWVINKTSGGSRQAHVRLTTGVRHRCENSSRMRRVARAMPTATGLTHRSSRR